MREPETRRCAICSDGEIIDRMCSMINSLEDDHKDCLKSKKEAMVKYASLQAELEEAK